MNTYLTLISSNLYPETGVQSLKGVSIVLKVKHVSNTLSKRGQGLYSPPPQGQAIREEEKPRNGIPKVYIYTHVYTTCFIA